MPARHDLTISRHIPDGFDARLTDVTIEIGVVSVMKDPDPTLWGGEPILLNGTTVGHTTSGAFGPTLGAAVAMGYIRRPDGEPITRQFIEDGDFEILNDGVRYAGRVFLSAAHDPKRESILA